MEKNKKINLLDFKSVFNEKSAKPLIVIDSLIIGGNVITFILTILNGDSLGFVISLSLHCIISIIGNVITLKHKHVSPRMNYYVVLYYLSIVVFLVFFVLDILL